MKKVQIKLWIEIDPFTRELIFNTNYNQLEFNKNKQPLIDEVYNIINSKMTDEHIIKKGESRESIIESLKDYQQKLMDEYNEKAGELVYYFRDNKLISYCGYIQFYDRDTRIITITNWED